MVWANRRCSQWPFPTFLALVCSWLCGALGAARFLGTHGTPNSPPSAAQTAGPVAAPRNQATPKAAFRASWQRVVVKNAHASIFDPRDIDRRLLLYGMQCLLHRNRRLPVSIWGHDVDLHELWRGFHEHVLPIVSWFQCDGPPGCSGGIHIRHAGASYSPQGSYLRT